MTSSELIQILRRRAKETQSDLAKAVGVSRSYVSEFENGRSSPSLGLLKAIAKHYKIPVILLVAPDLIGDAVEHEELVPIYEELRTLLGKVLTASIEVPSSPRSMKEPGK